MSPQREKLQDVLSMALLSLVESPPDGAYPEWPASVWPDHKLTQIEKDYDGYWKLWEQCIQHKKSTKMGFLLLTAKVGEEWQIAGSG